MLRHRCLFVLMALSGLGSLPLPGESEFALSYAETLALQVNEAIEQKDEARFDLASNKLIALLYAKKSNEVHKRVGELLMQFDIQWALPVMVECMDRTESIRANILGAILVGIVGTEHDAKLVSERRAAVAEKTEGDGLTLVHQWVVESGSTSVFLRIDRSKLLVPKKHLWSPDPE